MKSIKIDYLGNRLKSIIIDYLGNRLKSIKFLTNCTDFHKELILIDLCRESQSKLIILLKLIRECPI
jgi:hypothetical protein